MRVESQNLKQAKFLIKELMAINGLLTPTEKRQLELYRKNLEKGERYQPDPRRIR